MVMSSPSQPALIPRTLYQALPQKPRTHRSIVDEKQKSEEPTKIPLRKAPKDIGIGLVTLCNVTNAYTSQDFMISHDGNKVSMKKKRRRRRS